MKKADIFIGFQVNPEIAHDLSKNMLWKETIITRHITPLEIQEIVFQDKKYIGRYIQKTKISMDEIEAEEKAIRIRLEDFIEESKVAALPLQIFTQQFLF